VTFTAFAVDTRRVDWTTAIAAVRLLPIAVENPNVDANNVDVVRVEPRRVE
jgi:hypothetical protein